MPPKFKYPGWWPKNPSTGAPLPPPRNGLPYAHPIWMHPRKPGPVHARPDPRPVVAVPPIVPLSIGAGASLPPISSLSPGYKALMTDVREIDDKLLKEEVDRVSPSFEHSRVLWDGTKLTAAQKVRYLYDLNQGFGSYLYYKDWVRHGRPGDAVHVGNDAEIQRSFHMRIDWLMKDRDVQTWFQDVHVPALAARIATLPPIQAELNGVMQRDIVDGGMLKAATAKGLPLDVAARLHMMEFGRLQQLMVPSERKYYTEPAGKTLLDFVQRSILPAGATPTDAAQMANYYHLREDDLGDLKSAVDPMIDKFAKVHGLDRVAVAADVAQVLTMTVQSMRYGLKFSDACAKALRQSTSPNQSFGYLARNYAKLPPALRNAYTNGITHLVNSVTRGAAFAMRIGSSHGMNSTQKAALAFQACGIVGVAMEGGGPAAKHYLDWPADSSRVSAADIKATGQLLGGLGGMMGGFLTMATSIRNGDPATATLGSIGGVASILGGGSTFAEGVMAFMGATRVDALRPLRAIGGFVEGLRMDGSWATAFLKANLAMDASTELVITRVGLAGLGLATSGIGDLIAIGFMIKHLVDVFKGLSHAKNPYVEHANSAISTLIGSERLPELAKGWVDPQDRYYMPHPPQDRYDDPPPAGPGGWLPPHHP